MRRLLSFDPAKRPSAVEALQHPHVAQFHDAANERDAVRKVRAPRPRPPICDDTRAARGAACGGGTERAGACSAWQVQCVIDDNAKKSTAVYRERLYHEITKMKRKHKEKDGDRENHAPAAG